jgi:hypothetical protein
MKVKDKVNELFTYVIENKKSIIVGVVIGIILASSVS